jgi:hypothetical protein
MVKEGVAKGDAAQRARALFDRLDVNGDGALSFSEMTGVAYGHLSKHALMGSFRGCRESSFVSAHVLLCCRVHWSGPQDGAGRISLGVAQPRRTAAGAAPLCRGGGPHDACAGVQNAVQLHCDASASGPGAHQRLG